MLISFSRWFCDVICDAPLFYAMGGIRGAFWDEVGGGLQIDTNTNNDLQSLAGRR